jgi:aminobenzoyl-glutamate utilization protein B
MAEYREPMRKFYFDPTRYETYMEQLGIKYPTVRSGPASTAPDTPQDKSAAKKQRAKSE